MRRFDIRQYKQTMRQKYRTMRENMPPAEKAEKDRLILEKLLQTSYYQHADLVLTYVATEIEVDTKTLIAQCWKDGKRVAVPRCVDGSRAMFFYEITSFDQLEPHTFGVLEPVPEKTKRVQKFADAICIVPGLVFDNEGYRLGYGKGYYDRFLSTHLVKTPKIGICYRECIRYALHHGRFDVACNLVINDQFIRYIKKK